jgi:beta-galactosidase
VLHLFPHWNWPGREGDLVTVMCFTNCDAVELFLNGRSLGTRGYEFPRLGMQATYGTYPPRALEARTTGDLHLTWDVPYQAGTLKAVGSRLGKVVATDQVSTTGGAAAVALTLDRGSIHADRRDVCHVTARIVDAQGRTVPTAVNEVTFDVQGPGRLIGVDNGDQNNHDSYQSRKRAAYNGRCLAVVRSTAHTATVEVTPTPPGLRTASARFSAGGSPAPPAGRMGGDGAPPSP